MLDKIVIVNKHQAYFIFDDREPVGIRSDKCVRTFLRWFMGDPLVHLQVDNDGNWTGEFEIRRYDDEITVKIEIDTEAA